MRTERITSGFMMAGALCLGAVAQAATVAVDFELDGNNGQVQARAADSQSDLGDTWNFSDTVPLLDGDHLPASGNTNTVVFGGMKAGWGTSTNYNPKFVIDRSNQRLQLQINSGNPPNTMEGMLVWNQTGFLNGMDTNRVVFDAASFMTVSFSSINGTGRFAVKDGGSWYVSESTFSSTGSHTLNAPNTVGWAPVSTDGSYAIGPFETRSLMDIQGVGIYINWSAVNQANMKMENFRMAAVADDSLGSGYQQWAFSFPLSGGPYDDDDGDGASNIKEFSQGGNPTDPADTGYPVESWMAEASGAMWLYFKHPSRPGINSGVDYRVEVSEALLPASWLQAGGQFVETVTDGFEPGLDAVIYRVPADQSDQGFARIAADAVSAIPAPLANLDIFTKGFPHAIYFRATEGKASMAYSTWLNRYGHLDGVLGKMLDEEVYGRTTNSLPRYLEYKPDFPNQLALLHFNGNARDPRFDREAFAPQFFVHYVGCKSQETISSSESVSVIKVQDTSLFRTDIGRDNAGTDNITICALDAQGKPDWTVHEETILLSIDAVNSTIEVERGALGTAALAFPANQAYLAAHDYEGPWGVGSTQIMWSYNHSLKPPADSNGKLLWEVLAEDLGNRFLPGGQLELIDGIEFDVLADDRGTNSSDGRSKDFDGDGKKDGVDVNGINTYGVGVINFLTRLREIMGSGKLIMADGHSDRKQRGFNVLNGIESERWPNFGDEEIDEWSGGMNRHLFWLENAFHPAFSYIKYDPDVFVPNFQRLGYAAAVLTDTAISPAEKERNGFDAHEWDELRAGELNQWNWLGRPLGPVQHLALQQPNLFHGLELSSLITTSATKVDGPTGLELTENDQKIEFTLDVPGHLLGEDLTIFINLSADPIPGYPVTRNRLFELTEPVSNKVVMSWAGTKPFEAGFYFKDLDTAQLNATIESSERLTLHSVTAHACPDICYRIFENGVVIANPSLDPFTFDAATLLPGMNLQHLEAHPNQDASVNTGLPAGNQIQIPAKDAVFLIRADQM